MMNLQSLIPTKRNPAPARPADFENDAVTGFRREFDRLFDRMFDQAFGTGLDSFGAGVSEPRVDIVESDDGIELTADLPGWSEESISVDLADGVLTLSGSIDDTRTNGAGAGAGEDKRYFIHERARAAFTRSFALPFDPDADKAEARFKNGVLTVKVPRSRDADSRVKHIPLKS